MITEKDLFDSRFVVIPTLDKRTKKGKEDFSIIKSASMGKQIIKSELYDQATNMARSIQDSPYFYLFDKDCFEHSIYWEHNEVLLKTRPDNYDKKSGIVVDLKTTLSVNPKDYLKSIYNFGSHSQSAMFIDGLKSIGIDVNNVCHLAIEKNPPYICELFVIGNKTIERGRKEYYHAVEIYKQCLYADVWPTYSSSPIYIEIPDHILDKEII